VNENVWIGLVGVSDESKDKILGGARGAYVNALVPATSKKDYGQKVMAALKQVGLRTFEFDDVEEFSHRASQFKLRPQLKLLAKEAAKTGVVICDEFFGFKEAAKKTK